MKYLALCLLLVGGNAFAQSAGPGDRVRVCDRASSSRCASVGADGKIQIAGTVNSAGAADTLGANATYSANSICGFVALAGQLGAGFFLGAGTLTATLTPYLSEDSTDGTNGNWTASAFVDTSGNATATQAVTNPNGFLQFGIKTLAGSRYAKVCTTAFTSGTAVGFLVATTVPSPPPAAGADVTDRAGRLLGHVTVDSAPTTAVTGPLTDAQLRASAVPVSAASLPLPTGAATEATLAGVKTGTDKIPASPATDRTTAAGPFSTRLSDGAAFYKSTTPSDTQPISAASLPLPTGAATETTLAAIKTDVDKIPASPSTDRTTAASPFSVRISDGAAFLDPRSIRALTATDVVSINGTVPVSGTFWQATQPVSGTFWQATQPISGTVTANQGGTWTVQPGNTANTTAWKVDASGTTVPISAVSLPLPLAASTDATVAETHAVSLGSIPTRQDMIAGSDYGYSCNNGACSQIPRVDANGILYTGETSIVRVQVVSSINSLLPRCNPVRRINCQP